MFLKSSLLLLPLLITASQAIINGQRYSIQRAPFLFHGEGIVKATQWRTKFSGVILTDRFILTLNGIQDKVQDITITVGAANVLGEAAKHFHVGTAKNDDHLCIFELVDGPLDFGDGLQKASLPRWLSWKRKKALMIAGWGSVNWFNAYSAHLHYKLAYTEGGEGNEEGVGPHSPFFFLTAENGKGFALGGGNSGAAVWDEQTGEVLGLGVSSVTKKNNVVLKVVHLLPHILWVEQTIRIWEPPKEYIPTPATTPRPTQKPVVTTEEVQTTLKF